MARRKIAEKSESSSARRRRFLKMSKNDYNALGPAGKRKVIEVLSVSATKVYSKNAKAALESQIARLTGK